jgi:hypothetical protein
MTAVVHSGNAVRGCHCAHCDRRRRLNTQNARNAREQALAAAQFGQRLCPRRYGPGVCAGILETTIGSGGRTLVRCPRCERRKAGLCRDCNGRVEGEIGRASRCKECKRKFRNLVTARYVQANHDKVKAHSRAHYQNNPEIRARRNEYKRLYRKAHPEKVREQKRRYVAKYRERVTSKYAKYHARYRKKHQAYYRQLQNTRNALERKAPPKCTACGKSTRWKPIPGAVGRPWKTCNACAWPHQRKERLRIRRRALRRLREVAKVPTKPPKLVPPTAPATRGPGFERLCLVCHDVVVTHRKKKCSKCRELERQAALVKLAPFRGRGRRTDLPGKEHAA